MDGLTLITESKKGIAIASKFSMADENSLHCDQSALVQDTLREKPHYFSIILIIDTPKSIFFLFFFQRQ
jgi:hypothetical protein